MELTYSILCDLLECVYERHPNLGWINIPTLTEWDSATWFCKNDWFETLKITYSSGQLPLKGYNFDMPEALEPVNWGDFTSPFNSKAPDRSI